ncbi:MULTISPECIES: hypothetical protein [Micromonospora]|uniref:Uncharacterized protein n=2 Tax=Micromonospora TaxID=1873 RepID=A0A9W5UNY0_9ACTN|nr:MULTISPECIES: hypothetical protein [Micromonospora]MBX7269143.1 hypothetical protein [Micromonospora tarapacensis]WFE44946.1 hypothetical protein O7624_11670 [Verrucosispora sp. WMMD1129]SFD11446.1 hypothetical protein SAMN05216284_11164 [Micromonospora sediminimaris]GIJ08777.1 hypothetical protein Van01_19910 [Micromonospora andamanensis]GIJ32954.1 hypothetical protein Vse01_21020 [Micromonospora sediminimaris]
MTELATRAQAFSLVAEGVAAGLSAPWRLYLARGCRYLSLSVGDRAEWNAWRTHLGCPELSVRVYDAGGEIRRSSMAEVVMDGCRISVELVEEIGTDDLDRLLVADPTTVEPEER